MLGLSNHISVAQKECHLEQQCGRSVQWQSISEVELSMSGCLLDKISVERKYAKEVSPGDHLRREKYCSTTC